MQITQQTNRANTRIDSQSVNAIIDILQEPDQHTLVSDTYASSTNSQTQVKAYAKIVGRDWTFYIKKLSITIGRSQAYNETSNVDIDLYPVLSVSRQHAIINYNLHARCWELKVLGKNGVKIDGHKNISSIITLRSGCIINIMGTEMMFIETNSNITISPRYIALLESINKKMYLEKDTAPPYSYTTMITQALLADCEQMLSFDEIYSWILRQYPYFEYSRTTMSLQKAITHTLNVNKAFESRYQDQQDPSSPQIWRINDKFKHDLLHYISLEYQFTRFPTIANIQDISLRLSLHKKNL